MTLLVQSQRPPELATAEAIKIRKTVDRMLKRKEMKPFLIKHGFLTRSGKLSKRYGG